MSRITVSVKYFAALREWLGRGEDCLEVEETLSVGELWARVRAARADSLPGGGTPLPEAAGLRSMEVLATVNLEYVRAEQLLRAGDEVAFFPPVTGG